MLDDETIVTQPAPESAVNNAEPARQAGVEETPIVTMDEDKGINLADEFFSTMDIERQPDEPPSDDQPDPATAPASAASDAEPVTQAGVEGAAPPSPAPAYLEGEVATIPFERLERERLPEAVKAYLPVLDEYHQRVAAEMQRLQAENMALRQGQAPVSGAPQTPQKNYIDTLEVIDAKDLPKRARELAAERLGVEVEALDMYDAGQQAALAVAAAELAGRNQRNAEAREQYQRDAADYDRTCRDLQGSGHFPEFDRYLADMLSKNGISANALLAEVRENGSVRQLTNLIRSAYERFSAMKRTQAPAPAPTSATRKAQPVRKAGVEGAAAPLTGSRGHAPWLEGSGGGVPAGKKGIDMRIFSGADATEQAEMLMLGGVV